ncbi:MAG: CHRD domain-containing protein [Planctomycetes bacterium]|nr:CHRD domain-containing protein [Planctomycetota bacterium]
MEYYVAYAGLSAPETASHVHGYVRHGVSAGVRFPLALGSPKTGVWNYPAADQDAILNGLAYVNVHSTAFPGGEIRGQITRYVAPIDGRQESPPVATAGAGVGLFSMDLAADTMGYNIRHCGLSSAETASHIHGFAPRGVPAGVLTALPAGANKLGSWVYGAANELAVLDGRTYVNVHTATNPGGELRGQIEFPEPFCLGDVNCDRVIDLVDLTLLLSNFGGAGGKGQGDLNDDGIIDLRDLTLLLSSFGIVC